MCNKIFVSITAKKSGILLSPEHKPQSIMGSIMNKIYTCLIIINALTINSTLATHQNFEFYNNLDIYVYMSVTNSAEQKSFHFCSVEPGQYIHKELDYQTIHTIIVTEQEPSSSENLDAFDLTTEEQQSIILKLFKHDNAQLTVIPQKRVPLFTTTSFGGLPLETNISHRQIIKKKILYEPTPVEPQSVPINMAQEEIPVPIEELIQPQPDQQNSQPEHQIEQQQSQTTAQPIQEPESQQTVIDPVSLEQGTE